MTNYTTEQLSAAYTDLVKAQKGFDPALKTAMNPAFRSKYAGLDACIEAVQPALNANGFFLTQRTHETETGVSVETVFLHTSGVEISGGKLNLPAAKQDAQGYGSALTYARRYSLLAACGVAPENDDDGNSASKSAPVAPPAPKPAAPKPTPVTPKEVKPSTSTTQPTTTTGQQSTPSTSETSKSDLSSFDVNGLRAELTRLTALAKQDPTLEAQVATVMTTARDAGGVKRVSDLPLDTFRQVVESVQALLN